MVLVPAGQRSDAPVLGLTHHRGVLRVRARLVVAGVTGPVAVGSAAEIVLLRLPPSRAWFRKRSVRPAGPGL